MMKRNTISNVVFLEKCDFPPESVFQVTQSISFSLSRPSEQLYAEKLLHMHARNFPTLKITSSSWANCISEKVSQQILITFFNAHLSDEHDDGHTTSTDCELERFSDIFG
jgi:hypothetical protein